MSQTLTIVGASVRAAAQSAARAGMSVLAGDLFADVDLRRLCSCPRVSDYPRGLGAVLSGPQDGGWMYTGALENHAPLVGRWARVRPLWGNRADVLRRVRDPWRVSRAVRAAGLVAPDIAGVDAPPPRDGNWLHKPVRSAGGGHITRWDDRAPAVANLRGRSYFQQYVEGLACSAVYLAADGASVMLGVTRQLTGEHWTGAAGFRYCGSIGPLDVSPSALRTFIHLGAVLARAFELTGLFGVDAIVNSGGVWPVEVNPRYTASTELLDWACGISAVELHVAACRDGQLPRGVAMPRRTCGKAIVFAARPLVVTREFETSSSGHDDGWPTLADIPAAGTAMEAGWPIVTVLAEGTGDDEVLEKLRRRAGDVRRALGEHL